MFNLFSSMQDTVIDLQDFKLVKNTLFVEGIGIITGQNAKEYSDIDYKLIIEGESGKYVKRLGKANRPDLTKIYAKGLPFSYDKCWFATPNYKGVDIAEIPIGTYKLALKITVNGFEKTVVLCSKNNIQLDDSLFYFESNTTGNQLTIKQKPENNI